MAVNDTKYTVGVPLNPTDLPITNQTVIWKATEGAFNIIPSPSQNILTCLAAQAPTAGTITFNIPDISSSDMACLKGQLYGKVSNGSRFQLATVVIGWATNSDSSTRITVTEDLRYPETRLIYNINSFEISWGGNTDQFDITWSQYTVGSSPLTITYCMDYIVF